MKTLFTFAIAGALTLSSLAANASDDLRANSDVKASYKKVNVLLREGVGDAKVAILDQNGKKLHQRRIHLKGEDVIIPYNLNELPCGEYTVQILTDDEEVEYTVETFEKPVAPEALPLMAYGKVLDDETINLTVIGLEEPGVEVKMRYTETDKLIVTDEVDEPDGFKKNYKLKGITPSDVYLELKDSKGRTKSIYFDQE